MEEPERMESEGKPTNVVTNVLRNLRIHIHVRVSPEPARCQQAASGVRSVLVVLALKIVRTMAAKGSYCLS